MKLAFGRYGQTYFLSYMPEKWYTYELPYSTPALKNRYAVYGFNVIRRAVGRQCMNSMFDSIDGGGL